MINSGYFEGSMHIYPVRVYYEETDAGGYVYHANYLKFAERARSEFLRFLGFNQLTLINTHGIRFVIVECHLHCLASAYLDDELTIHTRFLSFKGARLCIKQEIYRNQKKITTLDVLLACINSTSKPCRISKDIHEKLIPYLLTAE